MNHFRLPEDLVGFRIHMVGIKGTGMAALSELLVARGAIISGSDVPEEFYTDAILKDLGLTVLSPFSSSNVGSDVELVIYSSAYSIKKNPELLSATERKIPTMLYSEALGEFSAHSYSCGVAGVHGKTTTTGMVGTLLKGLDMDASALSGSVISSFDNHCTMINGNRFFVAETCEYQYHFLTFQPQKILLTSIESDHQDCFPTYESILSAFMQYINKLPQFGELIYCSDDPGACEAARMIFSSRPDLVFTGYGENSNGNYKIEYRGIRNERQIFALKGIPGEFKLRVSGRHNIQNAAGAIALTLSLLEQTGKKPDFMLYGKLRESLELFTGSRRRGEIIGEAKGVLFMDDYGHHPTAIRSTLAGLKEFYPSRRLVLDFMSHTHSRTQALMDDFASSFNFADEVILHKVYTSAREGGDAEVTGRQLFELTKKKHRNVRYFNEVMDARSWLAQNLKSGDLFVTMGAGDNWQIGRAAFEDRRNT